MFESPPLSAYTVVGRVHYRDDLIILDVTFIQGRPKLRDTRRNPSPRRVLEIPQIRRVRTGIRMPSACME